MVVAGDGARLQKRSAGSVVGDLRDAGLPAEVVVGELAHGLGLAGTNRPTTAAEVAESLAGGGVVAWRRAPWPIPAALESAGGR
jgi:hypothetical protein